jgi:hypothetical protein
MKQLFLVIALLAGIAIPTTAFARPQLHTQSIGWIAKDNIDCPQMSDHICVVKPGLVVSTRVSRFSDEEKYRVREGTLLVILSGEEDDDDWAEVAIVIPGDWDQRKGHEGELRPYAPCRLKKTGKTPQIISLSCRKAKRGSHRVGRYAQVRH